MADNKRMPQFTKFCDCAPDADWHEYEGEDSREGSEDGDLY